MEEAKKFKQEFSNLRLMMTRMSNRLSEKTGFDPALGKDAQARCFFDMWDCGFLCQSGCPPAPVT